jgi:hypothetical protein
VLLAAWVAVIMAATSFAQQTGCSGGILPTGRRRPCQPPAASLPNFGNAVQGPTQNSTLTSFYSLGSYFVAPASGTYTTAHVYCLGSGSANQYVAIYNTSAGSLNGQSRVAYGTVTCGVTAGWVTGTISAPVVSGTTYFLSLFGTTGALYGYWDSTTGTAAFDNISGIPPVTASGWTNQTGKYSIYLTAP